MSASVIAARRLEIAAGVAVRPLRVALAGCGVVGGELARLIASRSANVEIVSVLVRDVSKPRNVPVAPRLFTNDVSHFLAHDADVVIEAIGGSKPAAEIARVTLGRGARLVTANKALLAEYGDALLALAEATGGRIDFEAAVGGGIPVIRALRNSLRAAPVRGIRAILNGTTNYVLTRMERGASFESAVAEAQANGFAEADPSRDLNGLDAADKLRVLAWIAFGSSPRGLEVRCEGVLTNAEELVRTAAAHGGCVRLIASCERGAGGDVVAHVRPEIVDRDSVFGRAVDEQNVIAIDYGWSQPLTFSGPGAGGVPTAHALLGDLLCC